MRPILLPIFLGLLLFTQGCAQNAVTLTYSPPAAILPSATTPSVTVVLFDDARADQVVGQRRGGGQYQVRSSVDYWVLHAFAGELAHTGLIVTFARSMEEAQRGQPDFIVTGSIDEIWLQEMSLTLYKCTMRASFSLLGPDASLIQKNTYSANLSRRVIPTSDVPEQMLSEALGDLVVPAAQAIAATIGGR